MRLLVVLLEARGSTSNGRDRVRVQLRGAQISHAQLHCLRLRRTNFDLCDKSAPQLFVRARCNPGSYLRDFLMLVLQFSIFWFISRQNSATKSTDVRLVNANFGY